MFWSFWRSWRMMLFQVNRRNRVQDLRIRIPILNAPTQFFVLVSQGADLLAELVVLDPKLLLLVEAPGPPPLTPSTEIRKC